MKVCSEYNCTTPFCPMPRLVRSACGYSLAECLQFSESKLQRQPLHLHCSLALQSSLFKATHFFSHHLSGFFEPPIILVVWHPPTAAWCITLSSSAPRSGRNATVTRSKLQSKAARMDGKVSQTAVFWESPESQSAWATTCGAQTRKLRTSSAKFCTEVVMWTLHLWAWDLFRETPAGRQNKRQ